MLDSSVCKQNTYSSAQIELIFYSLMKLLKVIQVYFYQCNEYRIQSTSFWKNVQCVQRFKRCLQSAVSNITSEKMFFVSCMPEVFRCLKFLAY